MTKKEKAQEILQTYGIKEPVVPIFDIAQNFGLQIKFVHMADNLSNVAGFLDKDGKTIYVGTAGGGIWKSTNAGASFKPIFDKYCQSIGAIAIDQKNPKTIYKCLSVVFSYPGNRQ